MSASIARTDARVAALTEALEDLHRRYYDPARFYHLPGSSPTTCLSCRVLAERPGIQTSRMTTGPGALASVVSRVAVR